MTKFYQLRIDNEDIVNRFEDKIFRLKKTRQEILLELVLDWIK